MKQHNKILLTNIQRFSLHDGPGIRTTVFLKGCSIHCPWCSNPENLVHREQRYVKKSRSGENDKDGKIEEEGVYGKWYTADELYKEVVKDKAFYGATHTNQTNTSQGNKEEPKNRNKKECGSDSSSVENLDSLPGGVTFSGGECMLQMKELEPLLQKLKNDHIHTAVETSLFCSPSQLYIALSHIDLFYVDIKILDDEKCREVLGGEIEIYKENLKSVLDSGKPLVFRIPVIGNYTDGEENRKAVVELIKEKTRRYTNIKKIEILKEHNLGTNKYQSLIDGGESSVSLPEYKGVEDSLMEKYKDEITEGLRKAGSTISVEICKI